jgi:hypothetical protein
LAIIATRSVSGCVFVTPPPVAVTVRLKEPAAVPEAAFNVSVLVPLPGDAMLAGAKLAVTPFGSPLTDSNTCDWNPYSAAVVSLIVADAPEDTVALVAFGVSEKLGGGMTVSVTGCVFVTPPPAAVIVRLKEPATVPEAAARVSVLVPLPGDAMLAGVKLVVTPLGSPLADSSICDWNPYSAAVVILMVVDAPADTIALVAAGVSEKLGGGKTVRLMGCVLVTPPPLAFTVKLKEPATVPEATVNVKVVLPLPGVAMAAGAKLAVTPLGSPLTDNAICDWKWLNAVVVSTSGVDAPGASETLVTLGVSLKPGTGVFAVAVPVRMNVSGPRETQVRLSPR